MVKAFGILIEGEMNVKQSLVVNQGFHKVAEVSKSKAALG
jgi:hypothetical protein